MFTGLGSEHVSGAENGAELAENRVERSGEMSWRGRKRRSGEERSAEREVAEQERSGERAFRFECGAAFFAAHAPLTLRSHALVEYRLGCVGTI